MKINALRIAAKTREQLGVADTSSSSSPARAGANSYSSGSPSSPLMKTSVSTELLRLHKTILSLAKRVEDAHAMNDVGEDSHNAFAPPAPAKPTSHGDNADSDGAPPVAAGSDDDNNGNDSDR